MFENKIIIRKDVIDGETDWYWIECDYGAWDGPKEDWIKSHKEKYLEHVKQRKVVITAGGNQGLYTRLYSKLFETVYSFEPDAFNFYCLVNNNQNENVIKMNCGLGAEVDMLSLKRPNMTNTGTHHLTKDPGNIPVLTIDTFHFPTVNLIQLDVEGYEVNVLKGASQTIQRCRPVVILERGTTEEIKYIMGSHDYEHTGHSVSDDIYVHKSFL